MGHLINPVSLRLGVSKTWNSHWVSNKFFTYGYLVTKDVELRKLMELFFSSRNFTSKWHFIVDNIFIIRTVQRVYVILVLISYKLQAFMARAFFRFFKGNLRLFFFNFMSPVPVMKRSRKYFSVKRKFRGFNREIFYKDSKFVQFYKPFINNKLTIGFQDSLRFGLSAFLTRVNFSLKSHVLLSNYFIFKLVYSSHYARFIVFCVLRFHLNRLRSQCVVLFKLFFRFLYGLLTSMKGFVSKRLDEFKLIFNTFFDWIKFNILWNWHIISSLRQFSRVTFTRCLRETDILLSLSSSKNNISYPLFSKLNNYVLFRRGFIFRPSLCHLIFSKVLFFIKKKNILLSNFIVSSNIKGYVKFAQYFFFVIQVKI